jgi:hypothetical protein
MLLPRVKRRPRRFDSYRPQVLQLESRVVPATAAQINTAINNAMAWLASQQAADGHIGSQYLVATTAQAVQTLEAKGNFPGAGKTYSAVVEKGLDYLFSQATTVAIGKQTHGQVQDNPDIYGDGLGVVIQSSGEPMYDEGIVMSAIAASNTPDGPHGTVKGGPLDGWTYKKVLQHMVSYCAWAQVDGDYIDWNGKDQGGEGGWIYGPINNDSSQGDGSVSQWPALGLSAAEQAPWKIFAPAFVKTELNKWVTYIQGDDGGCGYRYKNGGDGINEDISKTGGLLVMMQYLGDTPNTPRVKKALDYINTHWNETPASFPSGNIWYGNYGHPYAMFAVYKGLELMGVQTIPNAAATPNSLKGDWYGSFSDYLANPTSTVHSDFPTHQNVISTEGGTMGSWNGYPTTGYQYWNTTLATAWYADVLQKTVFVRPPEVDSVVIDDGTGQRAKVRSLTVTFEDPVIASAGAFSVTYADGTPVPGLALTVTPPLGTGNPAQVYTITFSGPLIVGGSLPDGQYKLTVNHAQVTNIAGQKMEEDYTTTFWRVSPGSGLKSSVFIPHPLNASHQTGTLVAWVSVTNTGPDIVGDIYVHFAISGGAWGGVYPSVTIRPVAAAGATLKAVTPGVNYAGAALSGGLKKGATATIEVILTTPNMTCIDWLRKNFAVTFLPPGS